MTNTEYANNLINHGLSVIPINMPGKNPSIKSWEEFQQRNPRIGELSYNGAIALICGKVSGNIECLDIDVKHDPTLTTRMREVFGDFIDEIWRSTVVQKTASGGYHLIYRCEVIEGNKKLANKVNTDNPKLKDSLLETRGEGGYIVIAPTPGYKLLNGSFDDIPTISPETRAKLFTLCRELNQVWEEVKAPSSRKFIEEVGGTTPWDDYNAKCDVNDLLQRNGWTFIKSKGSADFWKRPGTTDSLHSASFHRDHNTLYVYTSSTAFEQNKAYPPHAILTFLEHNGDFSASARALRQLGFGTPLQQVERTIHDNGQETTTVLTRIQRLEHWLSFRYDFRRNCITQQLFYRPKTSTQWRICNENDVWRDVQHNISELGRGRRGGEATMPITELCTILDSNFIPEYNPFADYFSTLPPWDGKDHISHLASHIVTDDQEFWIIQFKKALVRSIACTLSPFVNRIVMTLVSETQEIGKSQFIRFLCPPALASYYKEEALIHDKDSDIALTENFLWNLEELDDLNKKQISEMKATISRDSVKHRRAYARTEKSMPRIVNFWGSTNKSDFLTDTSNTRWMCFNVIDINHDYNNTATGTKNSDINKVYAQAYHLYNSDYNFNLTKEEREHRERRNQSFETMNDEKQLIMRFFAPSNILSSAAEFLSNLQIREHLDSQTNAKTRLNEHNIGRAMKQLGFEQSTKKVKGKIFRGYYVLKHSSPIDFDQEPINKPLFDETPF